MTTTVRGDFYFLSHAVLLTSISIIKQRSTGATEERFGSMHRFNLPTGTYLCLMQLGLDQVDVWYTFYLVVPNYWYTSKDKLGESNYRIVILLKKHDLHNTQVLVILYVFDNTDSITCTNFQLLLQHSEKVRNVNQLLGLGCQVKFGETRRFCVQLSYRNSSKKPRIRLIHRHQ